MRPEATAADACVLKLLLRMHASLGYTDAAYACVLKLYTDAADACVLKLYGCRARMPSACEQPHRATPSTVSKTFCGTDDDAEGNEEHRLHTCSSKIMRTCIVV